MQHHPPHDCLSRESLCRERLRAPQGPPRRRANKWIMFCFCAVLVIPLVAILVDIFVKAAPVLSLDYLWENPVNKGKEGGLWAPLVGTFYLVIGSLIFVAPVGILAAIYLNEYAQGRLAQPHHRHHRHQPRGRAEHRAWAFRPRRVRARDAPGHQPPGRQPERSDSHNGRPACSPLRSPSP